ncbi:hypothetical protein K461DRAFT_144950 [Myriangium duriaei CBS 260.36]|uniref:Rab-GAP TBC domain-containing protein n=1 Tax=Myriangium duriaei CBS 260.36 TaxID=1168546 RepID=A0A9P4IYQ4_9PEZI|nr:hypothetical protein K461DRAFT_144950 [Myriangium duriaei CBS 260.36]
MTDGSASPPSTRPSTQRIKSTPRGRRSTQSSNNTTKADEQPSLTSFEPFSSPARDHERERSQDSCSSSKRSRSIYAPDRQNSIDGGQYETTPATAEDRSATPLPPPRKDASKAAQSLMNTMMENERTEDSLFSEHDLQYFRQHPSAFAHIDNASLRGLSKRQSYFDMIRTLAGDLAQRDAEMVALRKRIEELGKIFKDHLCADHDLSRLDADRTLHSLTAASRQPADYSMHKSIEDAADTPLTENPFSDHHMLQSEGDPTSATTPPMSPRTDRALSQGGAGAVRGMLSVFGGRGGTIKKGKATKGGKESPLVSQLNSAKSSILHRRKSSIGSAASSKNLIPAPPGPVEMNAIVEIENLPPPLITQRDIQAQYPGYVADVYGFVIDSTRVNRFLEENRVTSPTVRSRGADTPLTSSSSVRSMPHDSEAESETPETDTVESSSWAAYLKFDTSTLGSLSWLPIVSASGTTLDDSDEGDDSLAEMGHSEAVKVLQQQLSDDFSRLQKSRLIPWEKFLSQDRTQTDGTSYVPSMFRRNQQNKPAAPQDIASQIATLPASMRAERIRLVLNGIPMSMRAQIYTSIALETLQPDPDEYRNLVAASATSVDPTLRAEIDDDVPRTLPNNVFFRPPSSEKHNSVTTTALSSSAPTPHTLPHATRPRSATTPVPESKGRAALRELLLAFLARRPEIGYCQGMNLIAGYLLLCLPTTESAFWVFVYLIEHPLSDIYFDATLRGASIEICVLRSFIDELVPRLGRKLAAESVEPRESAPYNWFLTAFASALSVEAVYRVWDVLLGLPPAVNKGKPVPTSTGALIRLGVGLCKAFEDDLLALDSGFEVRGFMDRMAVGGVRAFHGSENGNNGKQRGQGRGIGIDGLVKASWKLGAVIRDEEIRRRRKYFALKIDESALG